MFNVKRLRYKPLYKKILKLRVDVNTNNKIFKLKKKKWENFPKILRETIPNIKSILFSISEKMQEENQKKKEQELEKLVKIRFEIRPITNSNYFSYMVTKFASRGNAFKKKFKKDLIAKKTFNYFYGNLKKNYLKKRMTFLYNSKKCFNIQQNCLEFFETHLDTVLYRAKFCLNINNARQILSHKHVAVNGIVSKNKHYILKPFDTVSVTHRAFSLVKSYLFKLTKSHEETTNLVNILLHNNINITKRKPINTILKIWPIPPMYLMINYKTLEIVFNSTNKFNFSIYTSLKLNIHSIVINYYRH